MTLPDEIEAHLSHVRACLGENLQSLWLIGSRANDCARDDSDWDFILFSDAAGLRLLQAAPHLKKDKIDLLVVADGIAADDPWPIPGETVRSILLAYADWQITGPDTATYRNADKR